jgi:inosine-uridine nucleoside N-ribohydrolase
VLRVLYDSDLIGDDLLTLIIAAGAEGIKIEGITSFGRRIPAIQRARIAASLLVTLGLEGIPIAAGADKPLVRPPRVGCTACDEPIIRFYETQSQRPDIKKGIREMVRSIPATQLIIETIKQSPGQITLLCTGPLTNIAQAYNEAPEIAELTAKLVIMGGAAWISGNVSPVAESNIYTDPEAAAVVFQRFSPIVMVGLDVTMRTVITTDDIRDIPIGHATLAALIHGIISSCAAKHRERGEESIMPLHDPLALLVAETPPLVRTVPCTVTVDQGGDSTRGRTVCKALERDQGDSGGIWVASEVDVKRASKLFLSYLRTACNR